MSKHWFDTSRHPLHSLVFPERYSYEELDAELNRMRDEYRRMVKERPQDVCAILVDLSRAERSEPRNRKRIADSLEELSGLMRTRLVAQAYVIDRPLIRAALTALSWVQSPPWPVQTFADRASAEAWLRQHLEHGDVRRRAGAR